MKIDFSNHTKLDKETYLAFQSFCNDNKNYFIGLNYYTTDGISAIADND